MADPRLLDKKWRLEHCYWIKTKDEQLVRFKRNRAQQHFNANRWSRNIILKSRQLGFTTDACIDMLDDALFSPNFDALLLADTKENATDIFDNKVSLAWEMFRLQHLYQVKSDRANKLKFGLGPGIFSSVAVKASGRSGTFRRLHVSELGKKAKLYPDQANEVITGTIPAVPLDGRVDIESTAEGETGIFYEMFWEWWKKKPVHPVDYKAHFYNWTWDDAELAKIRYAVPNLPPEFRDYQRQHKLTDLQITYWYFKWLSLNKSWDRLLQEYPTTPEEAFIRSGNKLFDVNALELQKQFIKDPTKIGDWSIFHPYKPGHDYILGADVAEGVGADSSTAGILDVTPLKPRLVATYRSNVIEPDRFAYELRDGAHRYGCPMIGVERNNHGHTTLATLKGIYPIEAIYAEITEDKKQDKKTDKLGFPMNLVTKPKVLYDLKAAIDDALLEIPSEEMLVEARTYDKANLNVLKAAPGATRHWDLLTALAIAWYLRNERVPKKKPTTWKQPDYVPQSDYEGH